MQIDHAGRKGGAGARDAGEEAERLVGIGKWASVVDDRKPDRGAEFGGKGCMPGERGDERAMRRKKQLVEGV